MDEDYRLTLPLFMAGVRTNYSNYTVTADDLAIATDSLHRSAHFHQSFSKYSGRCL